MKKQTAGRDALRSFAPKFAELNDDVLFGEVWSREDKLSLRDRSVITVTALITKGVFDNSLKYHITNAKNHGVSAEEMSEIITHLAFYVGWPNAWAAFALAKEVYVEQSTK
ncbi:MAG: carboxymuconolactone decarboxylase family protein [Desulfosporosinus sp.]|nr:carboxymuconolactone decarboxylase family protein [Desulfosporosinus sp.]